jgi:hypothetical protein
LPFAAIIAALPVNPAIAAAQATVLYALIKFGLIIGAIGIVFEILKAILSKRGRKKRKDKPGKS